MRSIGPESIHVAVAIVINSEGKILIARRPDGVHLAGLWEFPGGKVKAEEDVFTALQRELAEETGIKIKSARPLINVFHNYTEKKVRLDTWLVTNWSGIAQGLEGQVIRWLDLNDLQDLELPEADWPIISALKLPPCYQISPEPDQDLDVFLGKIESCLVNGTKLFQLRVKSSCWSTLKQLASPLQQLCEKYQAKWLINGDPDDVTELNADGVHLSSERLLSLSERPVSSDYLIGASCHNERELKHAVAIGADFAVLAPVRETLSHPDVNPLGLDAFERLVENINIPVYALGGMAQEDLTAVWNRGGQGVAMIRSGWPDD